MRWRSKWWVGAVVLVGALAGWLTAGGRTSAPADDKPGPEPAPRYTVLPPPAPPFNGEINLRAADSKPDFPQPYQAPKEPFRD